MSFSFKNVGTVAYKIPTPCDLRNGRLSFSVLLTLEASGSHVRPGASSEPARAAEATRWGAGRQASPQQTAERPRNRVTSPSIAPVQRSTISSAPPHPRRRTIAVRRKGDTGSAPQRPGCDWAAAVARATGASQSCCCRRRLC
jgi:hypothetical protein